MSNYIYLAHTVCNQTYFHWLHRPKKGIRKLILTTSLLSSHCLLAGTPIHNIQTDHILLYVTVRFVFNLDNYVFVHYEYPYYLHQCSLIITNSVMYEITV